MRERKPLRPWRWLPAAGAAAALALCGARARVAARGPFAARTRADWFLAVRLPPLNGTGARGELEARRLAEWLDSLARGGFSPVTLSDARSLRERGRRLPGKPVLLVVEPGYARAYAGMLPVLLARGWSSLWLVDGEAVRRGDERYLSPHALSGLEGLRLCETGFLDGSTRAFTVSGASFVWAPEAGRRALNRGGAGPLNRLNANFSWTGAQLAARLQAEVPAASGGRLGAVSLYGRRWGVALDPWATAGAASFDLDAAPEEKSASLSWQGTSGLADLNLDLSAESVVGELWVYLRYDRAKGRGVRVGLTPESVVVEELDEGRSRRLGELPRGDRSGAPLRAGLRLSGRSLSVFAPGGEARFRLSRPGSTDGIVLLLAYDKIRGVASARSVRLVLKPS